MPSWNEILEEVRTAGSTYDVVRRKYLKELSNHTGRNVIVYYSGWLQKAELARRGLLGFEINDADKNGFMAAICRLDRTKGLDLVLHTPGGGMDATESLVDYLRSMFGTNIRAIIPQIAMSAGTMIALSCKEIIMGKHSSIGPIDPQFNGIAAHGIIEEFQEARKDILENQLLANLWHPIIAKYHPTLIGDCQKAIAQANNMVKKWLMTGMFEGESDTETKADKILKELGEHSITLSHGRHISKEQAENIGIKVTQLEENDDLQDAVLTVHHACIQTLSGTPAFKIIENQEGIAFIQTMSPVAISA